MLNNSNHCSNSSVSDVNITVPWGVISGKWWGSKTQRPILCIPGWQDNASTFDPLMNLLSKNVSFLCIDLPGHGLSSHLPKGVPYYLWWDGVIYIRRIAKHFGWNKVSIMGHSLGGGVGYIYAASFPKETDLLISLDVIAPIFSCQPEEIADGIPAIIDGFLEYDSMDGSKEPCGSYDDMIDLIEVGHNNTLSRKKSEVMARRGMRSYGNDTYRFTRDNRVKVGWLGRPTIELTMELAKRIKCRYLNIKSVPGRTMDNWATYKQILDIIQQNSEDFKFHRVDGNHHVHLNEPEKIAPLINEFLSSRST